MNKKILKYLGPVRFLKRKSYVKTHIRKSEEKEELILQQYCQVQTENEVEDDENYMSVQNEWVDVNIVEED